MASHIFDWSSPGLIRATTLNRCTLINCPNELDPLRVKAHQRHVMLEIATRLHRSNL